jgi:hypothetical protein
MKTSHFWALQNQPGGKKLVLPGLQWVKLGFPASSLRTFSLKTRLFRGVQCQASTVKEDGSLHELPIAETKGVFLLLLSSS